MLNQLSIQAKLIITTSLLLLCGSMISLGMNHSALTNIATRQFEQQLELAATALTEQMGGAVRFNKAENLQAVYRTLRKRYPDVLSAIIVTNTKGDVLLADAREDHYQTLLKEVTGDEKKPKQGSTSHHEIDGKIYFVNQTPILFSDKRQPVGTLLLLADFDAVNQDVLSISRDLLLVWAGILVTIIVLVLISSSVVLQTPLLRLHELVKNLNDGQANLGSRIDINGSREITSIATEFNRFINTIQSLVTQLIEQTQVLTELKRTGGRVSSHLQQVVNVQNDKLGSTSREVESLAGITGRIRQLAEKSSKQIDNVTQIARDSNQSIIGVRDQIVSLEQSIQDSSKAINDLSEKSQTIGSVLDVIRGIAEQTNLLALNAAIEAARAGEQGRGFAVVADEVRSLAGKTQQSTEEIQAMIGGLQSGSLRAVEQMQASSNDVRNSVQRIAQASEIIASVGTRINEMKNANSEIDQISRDQLSVSEHLTELLESVMASSHETSKHVTENQQITQRIENEISRSESIIAQFRH